MAEFEKCGKIMRNKKVPCARRAGHGGNCTTAECLAAKYAAKQAKRASKPKREPKPLVASECVWCGDSFYPSNNYRSREQKGCTKSHALKYYRWSKHGWTNDRVAALWAEVTSDAA